ncbi:MAG: PQQ-binding-like beta-propeller repeat protein [Thermoplasmatota archaeon]
MGLSSIQKILAVSLISLLIISSLSIIIVGSDGINLDDDQIITNNSQNGLADSPWPRWRGNNQGTGLSPYNTSFLDGTEKWNITIDGSIKSQPVIGSDGTIYICTNKTIHAIKNKKEIWNVSIESRVPYWTTPAVSSDGHLYITSTDGNLTAISPEGKIEWSKFLDVHLRSTPVIGWDGTIYVSDNNCVYAIDPNGTLKWCTGQDVVIFPIGGNSPVIGNDGNIYFGTEDLNMGSIFFSINKSGEKNWENHHVGNSLSHSPAVGEDGTIYFGSTDGLYAMHTNGAIKWTFNPNNNSMLVSPGIDKKGNIYTGDSKGNFYSVSPDGEKRWNYTVNTDIFSPPVIGNDGRIYFTDDNSTLHALNNDGEEIWNFSTDHDLGGFSPAINSDGTLYYASGNKLYALGPSSPTVDITRPSSGESMKTKSVKLEWESTTIGSDIDHFKVRLDGDDFQNVGSVNQYEFTDITVGNHTAEVKAVAESNNYDIDSIEFTVEEDTTPPTADAGEDRTVKVDEKVTFDALGSSDNREITSYEWDFDDGTTANGETVTHKFDEKGTYEVTLTVSDEAGNTDTDTVTVTVEKKDEDGIPGFGIIGLLLIISLIALYNYGKRLCRNPFL